MPVLRLERGAGFEPANAYATGFLEREPSLGSSPFKSCAVSGLGYPRVLQRAGVARGSSLFAVRAGAFLSDTRLGKYFSRITSDTAFTHR